MTSRATRITTSTLIQRTYEARAMLGRLAENSAAVRWMVERLSAIHHERAQEWDARRQKNEARWKRIANGTQAPLRLTR